ncbi:MAG TPA: sigma factor, partial [Planctomycetota bacterium]|nr:sigma factor [Planctomycetota bacterium]
MNETPIALGPDALLTHRAFVRAIARGLLDEHLADDVAQDAWLAVRDRAPRARGSLRAWIAAIARNLSLQTLRERRRR